MIISVINYTAGSLTDQVIQAAIRAVNRQVAEDFFSYWGFGAQLRLEGKSNRRRGNTNTTSDMRGDAILYLCDEVWRLALDEIVDTGVSVRPRLPLGHRHTGARALAGAGTLPLSQIVQPLVLDPLSVAGDAEFIPSIRTQRNLPPWLAEELVSLY